MKLIVVCASLDLTQPFSATPAWWQLLKALYEIGVDVIATPYQGPAIESLWWRAARQRSAISKKVKTQPTMRRWWIGLYGVRSGR
jgi:hypothetical protein